jgi:hypothetical protein
VEQARSYQWPSDLALSIDGGVMINNTFYIVFRRGDHRDVIKNDNQDRWGWEFVDNIEYFDYNEAKRIREEYAKAFPRFAVRLRAVPTKSGLYTEQDIERMRPHGKN